MTYDNMLVYYIFIELYVCLLVCQVEIHKHT
jgi:hypothetical protein